MAKKRSPGCNCCGGETCVIFDINQDTEANKDAMNGKVTWSGTGDFRGVLAPGEWVEANATIPSSEMTQFRLKYTTPRESVSVLEASNLPSSGQFGAEGTIEVSGLPVLTGSDEYTVEHEMVFSCTGDLESISGQWLEIADVVGNVADFPGFTYSGNGPVTRNVTGPTTQDPNGTWRYELANSNWLSSVVTLDSWTITLTSSVEGAGERAEYSKPMEWTLSARDANNKGWTRTRSYVRGELVECFSIPEYDSLNNFQPTGKSYQAEYFVKNVTTHNDSGTESSAANGTRYNNDYVFYHYTDAPSGQLYGFDPNTSNGDIQARHDWVEDGNEGVPQQLDAVIGLDWLYFSGSADSVTDEFAGVDLLNETFPWDRTTNYDLTVRLTNDSDIASIDVLELFATRTDGIQSGDTGYYSCQTPPTSLSKPSCPTPIVPCSAQDPVSKFMTAHVIEPDYDWIPSLETNDLTSYWRGRVDPCDPSVLSDGCNGDILDGGDIDISSINFNPPTPVVTYELVSSTATSTYEEWTYEWTLPAEQTAIDEAPWFANGAGGDHNLELFEFDANNYELFGSSRIIAPTSATTSQGLGDPNDSACSQPGSLSGTIDRFAPYSFIDWNGSSNTEPVLSTQSTYCRDDPSWTTSGVLSQPYNSRSAPFLKCDVADSLKVVLTGESAGNTVTVADRLVGKFRWCSTDFSPNCTDGSVITGKITKLVDISTGTTTWGYSGSRGVYMTYVDESTTRNVDPTLCNVSVEFKDRP